MPASLSKKLLSAVLNALILFSSAPSGSLLAAEPAAYPEVVVVGSSENRDKLPGSAQSVDKKTLEASRPFTASEVLRKLPGVNVRDEEGLGLRPNVGFRGLNPTRSTKVTLLEDGLPAAYAPYGDNASYYHPPIDRFERVEALKGVGQLRFGPQTIGGVINYITPEPSQELGGFVSIAGGNRNFFDGKVRLTGRGALFDYTRKQGQGARDNTYSTLNDANLKAVVRFADKHALTIKGNAYTEDSQVTYSGITEAERSNFGLRYNPFKNDRFVGRRFAGSALHEVLLGSARLATGLYYSYFTRDWWRQSSSTTDNQGGVVAARNAGSAINVDAINSVQGRLRNYTTKGVESRVSVPYAALGLDNTLEAGLKAHFELQDRRQVNGVTPLARDGALVENNERKTDAYSGFVMHRFGYGAFALTPALRYERVASERTDRLTGARGRDSLGRWIPGLGATWSPISALTLFAGAHRGFAPPRTEDIIAGAGTQTDVGPEDSTNVEAGLRARPTATSNVDLTFFRNDFDRLIAVGSIAGGSTPLADGKALFQGIELSGQYAHATGLYTRAAYTWLETAEQTTAFRQVVGGAVIAGSSAGNRQPYAPEHLLTAALGWEGGGLDANLESVFVDEQYANFSNTRQTAASGQSGTIPSYVVWNAAVNYTIKPWNATLFLTVKNLFDKDYIIDRTRGILPGSPRLVQGGVKYAF